MKTSHSIQYALTWAQAMGAFNRGAFSWSIELFDSIGETGMSAWVRIQQGKPA